MTPLVISSYRGHSKKVTILLEAGANINHQTKVRYSLEDGANTQQCSKYLNVHIIIIT